MRICIIVDDYLPNSTKVAAKMMHELAVKLKEKGHEITVITPGIGLDEHYRKKSLDGISILQFSSGRIKNVSKVIRLINELMLSKRAWRRLKKYFIQNRHDLIIYYSPSIFWGSLVFRLKKLWRIPSYLILRDFFPQWIIDNGMIREKSLMAYFFRYYERLNYKTANRIGIQSPANMEWFSMKFPEFKNIRLLYNWASDSPALNRENFYRKKLNLEGKVVFFYGGNIGKAQDMMNILRLAEKMKVHTNVVFLLVGAGDEVELVRTSMRDLKLDNMILLNPVSQEEFKTMLAEFDVGLFTLHFNHKTHNFPGKILGYMVQGKPILGVVNPGNDLKKTLEDSQSGLITIAGDDEGLYKNALVLLDEKIRKQMGKNANLLLKSKFSVDSAAETVLEILS
ncbi:glycosyltransferase family 4 protein [Leptospira santarosai]|uniref:glycosyltransferase family 4 protein n=1 Tax=Leptospira santarosai TaxID=28183 RepID=UPI0002BC52AF|nr:glycosyltransferase family 4 protein [Leptospira santarosai]EMF89280.1 glycosyltransferase, group 1 family protein [Leptospira santarosai str. ST188]EMO84757.1 glycosyltransferase, group 1 family protein [Leptospira santarosai str. AIM]EPG82602.1 glycosyltransferase, group 1 family protein [Leptospira santarosai serovar Shermani str. 1342KT]MDI7198345.1 glycosyltransferase family 4 protein [Leptospira santarosai]MDI7204221.1 glycosyltransferase family 4 protein [Leptospira santarosai]